jgi:phenylalanyl-tRNA synthetase beta chain
MNISFNWLKEYVTIKESHDEIADLLTMAGLEVEAIHSTEKKYEHFVVGEVLEARKHPNADRLTVCEVFDGDRKHTVVCGAPNVAAGQKIVFSRVGAVVPVNGMEVKEVEIRGQTSAGMICSEYELDTGDDHEGILVLPDTAKPGRSFADYYWGNDVVFEVGITPNRPDCLSHIGIARDLAALLKRRLRFPEISLKESGRSVKDALSISIEDIGHCPRYVGRLIEGIRIVSSPEWMQRRLKAVGIRPINAVVDVTNYVMMEYGQPLHAFDFGRITGGNILVRLAADGERFVTLDDKERTLSGRNLLICDAERPVAIAGVMGGQNSEIGDDTASVLIESAYFAPWSVRHTSKMLGLSTESSYRFERGIDPSHTAHAADRAAQLMQEISGGVLYRGRVDTYPEKIKPLSVPFRTTQVDRVLGIRIPAPTVKSMLHRLGVGVRGTAKRGVWRCTVPLHRPDIEREIDLIEEVARIYGYDNIPAETTASITFTADDARPGLHERLREWFVGAGFQEILCNSMIPETWNRGTGREPIWLQNPQNQDMTTLRTSLLPGMLGVVKHNLNRGNENLRLYEIGHVFSGTEFPGSKNYIGRYHEGEAVGLILTGLRNHGDWSLKSEKVDFFDIKGEIESLLNKFNLDKIKYNIYHGTSDTLIDDAIRIDFQGVRKGYLGKISDEVLKVFDIESTVYAAEIDLALFEAFADNEKKYREVPKYPPVHRDLAFVVEESVSYGELEEIIRSSGHPLVRTISFFDMYRGEKLGSNMKSIAVSLELFSYSKTLTHPEIEETVARIVRAVQERVGGVLRS